MTSPFSFEIFEAKSREDYQQGKILFEEYAKSLSFSLCFQNFSSELEKISEVYGPPKGFLLLAKSGNLFLGCLGVRPFSQTSAELKRLYVKPEYRKLKIGESLLSRSMARAASLGYDSLRLDTLSSMENALKLYQKKGFHKTDPFRENPFSQAVFLEKEL